jgi:hypothetical protein
MKEEEDFGSSSVIRDEMMRRMKNQERSEYFLFSTFDQKKRTVQTSMEREKITRQQRDHRRVKTHQSLYHAILHPSLSKLTLSLAGAHPETGFVMNRELTSLQTKSATSCQTLFPNIFCMHIKVEESRDVILVKLMLQPIKRAQQLSVKLSLPQSRDLFLQRVSLQKEK